MKTKFAISFFTFLLITGFANRAFGIFFSFKPDSIRIEIDPEQLILPGESFDMGVISYHKRGKVRKTLGLKGGFVLWWRYKVEVVGGTFASGKVFVNEQLMPSKGKFIEIKVFPKKRPKLMTRVLIPLNYETEVLFRPLNHFDKAPGSVVKGEIVSKFDNGQIRILKKLHRNAEVEKYRVTAFGGNFDKGRFYIDPDFLNIENHTASLVVQSLRNYAVADTFNVKMDYKHAYRLNFSGTGGFLGFSGSNGISGSTGSRGGDGQPGQNGGPGGDAPDVGVWIDLYFDSLLNCNLLYVFAENLFTGKESRYLVNPTGGSFYISSVGGNGGNGGDGGFGGNGGKGYDGRIWYEQKVIEKVVKKPRIRRVEKKITKKVVDAEGKEKEVVETVWEEETYYVDVIEREVISIKHQEPGERGGDGGNGGNGGFAGQGGNGGNIFLYFTEDSRVHENIFTARTTGGTGGLNGNGGSGGSGGPGGDGEPNGPSGYNGSSGYAPMGWAPDGWDGEVFRGTTDEFYIIQPQEEPTAEKNALPDINSY
ncbi:hypothetical protein [Mariniphaga sediminis]|uniref:hypothetical protein n=1 Tax=Mariniphaga sediminis TaxID=1628158 RepID=UPI00356AF092